jgi:hypothetical protein
MNNEQVLRIKSAMIIYSLEKSLGNFVLNSDLPENLSESNISVISERIHENNNTNGIDKISLLIESSYLDEIFNFAVDTTKDTSFETKMRALKTYCSTLNIFDIRNAISHPNRPFPDTFWFRSAAIASDPLILQLGLGEVRQALNSAILEQIVPPPDEWINNVKWAIPNTIPENFDHEITGLIGRDSEYKDLEATISKPRVNLVAIVAPGGIGKTALILQFLKDISLDPKWSTKINSIIFCTLKNERLTPDGIEKIEAINGIEQIKNSITEDLKSIYIDKNFESFDEATQQLESEKILICIDNLETLLVHSQKEFLDFNKSLPIFWKVIVTSRISIDSASTIPIQPLGKRYAVNLCRNYFKRRGISNFKQEDLEYIAAKASNNPLAIRLTVDLYLKGIDISESISQSQKDIAAFSYNNLIEALNEYSIWVLEAIYVSGNVNKSQLLDLLELSNDEISESINELSRTSLVVRDASETGNDQFSLSDSIKDLLLINPINIEIRNKISSKIRERKSKIQEQLNRNQILGINEFDVDYISNSVSDTIRALVVDLNKALNRPYAKRNHTDLVQLKNRFSELLSFHQNNHELLFHYSRILKALKDDVGETRIIEEALKIDTNNPRYLLAKALNQFHKKNSDEALVIFEVLVKKGFGNPLNSSKKFATSLVKLNFLCLLNIGNYTEILKRTLHWRDEVDWSIIMGTYRATALKRSVEIKRQDYQEKEMVFNEILEIYNFIFLNEGYPHLACNEALKFLKDFSVINLKSSYSVDFIFTLTSFVATHFFNIITEIKGQTVENLENRSLIEKLQTFKFESKENPLNSAKWFVPEKVVQYDKDHIEDLIEEGYTIVRIHNIPENSYGLSSFIFAKDKLDNQFFLHVDNFESGWTRWGYLQLNDKLAVKYKEISINKATVPFQIIEIDKVEM